MGKAGIAWKTSDGVMPNSIQLPIDDTLTPMDGDLCTRGADGEMEYMPSTAAASSAALRTIWAICVTDINPDNKINNPGYHAATEFSRAVAMFGGRPSRGTEGAHKYFVPVTSDLELVMELSDGEVDIIPGISTFGVNRVAAGDYVLDVTDTQGVFLVTGYYTGDIDAGKDRPSVAGSPAAADTTRVWVKAVLPGGDAFA